MLKVNDLLTEINENKKAAQYIKSYFTNKINNIRQLKKDNI